MFCRRSNEKNRRIVSMGSRELPAPGYASPTDPGGWYDQIGDSCQLSFSFAALCRGHALDHEIDGSKVPVQSDKRGRLFKMIWGLRDVEQSFLKETARLQRWIEHYLSVFSAAFIIFLFLPVTSFAQQTDADFNAYCRAKFNNSTYQKFPQSWGTEHACVQSGTRQGIDLAGACYLTTGNRQFEVSGARVLCSGTPDGAPDPTADDLGEPDFARYCQETFAGSTYEKRPEPQGTGHYCRRPGSTGGFTLQPINLAAACRAALGSEAFRINDTRVFCVREDSSGANAPGTFIPGGPSRPGNPDAPPDLSNGPLPDLPFPGPTFPGPALPGPAAEVPALPDQPGDTIVAQACLATPAGVWTSGTLALVDDIGLNMDRELNKPCVGPAELCRGHFGSVATQGYFETLMIFQCHVAFFKYSEAPPLQDVALAVDEACKIELNLNDILAKVQSFGFSMPAQHYLMISEPEFHKICDCKTEETDFRALVEESMRQVDKNLLEEFLQ